MGQMLHMLLKNLIDEFHVVDRGISRTNFYGYNELPLPITAAWDNASTVSHRTKCSGMLLLSLKFFF